VSNHLERPGEIVCRDRRDGARGGIAVDQDG
jgi:hypothetical protein